MKATGEETAFLADIPLILAQRSS